MVFFFGILNPALGSPSAPDEAPRKVSFFGGAPEAAFGAVPMSRAEQDACYLAGKAPEPVHTEHHPVHRFAEAARHA